MPNNNASIYLDTNRTIAEISPLLFAGFAVVEPTFASWQNLQTIANRSAIPLVLAIGMTFIICMSMPKTIPPATPPRAPPTMPGARRVVVPVPLPVLVVVVISRSLRQAPTIGSHDAKSERHASSVIVPTFPGVQFDGRPHAASQQQGLHASPVRVHLNGHERAREGMSGRREDS